MLGAYGGQLDGSGSNDVGLTSDTYGKRRLPKVQYNLF
jgi:hypothetical protein